MAYVHEYLHLLPLLLLSFTTCFLSAISTTDKTSTFSGNSLAPSTSKPRRFVSKLIHPHSIHHPHYNPNETVEDWIKLDIEYSHTRLSFFKARIEGSLDSNNDYRTHLSPSPKGASILVNLSIGQPPIPQLLIMDTASSIFWTMCTPCPNCIQHPGQIFDPSKSSTYVPTCKEPCYSKDCECDQLTYTVTYADESSSKKLKFQKNVYTNTTLMEYQLN
ncbi:putative nepenthesin [Medicago truncatula]|uniref:Eukaryotic aspartyl protease family protein n=1 Tax=Medicago truncatula TaxID=3880 RepID=Q2HUN7_MEDTR|nr:Peptidase M, neutral zinc metallopeptidases, zinc-binding site; Peptidase aspartic, catalytic [Medicago truncatula]AES65287.1 eukaryotic aspartyl protease family protein [Medicago truncatula]RHN73441.1 putative nepenthesin [Medicago truncatula]